MSRGKYDQIENTRITLIDLDFWKLKEENEADTQKPKEQLLSKRMI